MLQGYRTYIVSFLIALFGALTVLDWNKFLDDPAAGWTAIVAAAAMAFMRSITTTPPAVSASK